jgi:F420-dependent oxidoreductase-like protein
MPTHRIGATAAGGDSKAVVERIQEYERLGIGAAWLTTGGVAPDSLTLFAAAALQTKSILLGTSIVPIFPRHPLVMLQQAQVVAQLSSGRFRLGLGPSHKPSTEATYGFEFKEPLTHLRECIHIIRQLTSTGSVDFDGKYFHAHARSGAAPLPPLPIMASALRKRSFELCGEVADGAITWVCPQRYLRDVALPAMQAGAAKAGRETPPLIAHVPVCVHDSLPEARAAVRQRLAFYPNLPFYRQMLVDAGYPEAKEGAWSDAMLDAVAAMGSEKTVTSRTQEIFSWGIGEIIADPIPAGQDSRGSARRALELLASLSRSLPAR